MAAKEVGVEERHLSLSEAADALNISERTAYRWIKSGKLLAFKPGRDYWIPESAVRDVVEESRIRPKVESRSPSEPSLFNGLEEERHYEEYEDVLKALGFGQEQIEAWKAQDARDKEFIERELERERRRIEKLSPKELREELMARSLAEKRLRRYFADQQAEYTERRAQEPEAG
jgi:excisionase family DNA binding protein